MRKLKPSPINLHHFQRKARGNLMEKPLGSGPQLICFVILVKKVPEDFMGCSIFCVLYLKQSNLSEPLLVRDVWF